MALTSFNVMMANAFQQSKNVTLGLTVPEEKMKQAVK